MFQPACLVIAPAFVLCSCELVGFESRLERMNQNCCAIAEGCEDQGFCSSIPSALDQQRQDAARTCEANPCSLTPVDTSGFDQNAGPFELGQAVCLDAAGMHVLDSATGLDVVLAWPFESPPHGYPQYLDEQSIFTNTNHYLCICPSTEPAHAFKTRTMFGDDCQSSTDLCGGNSCPESENLVGLSTQDIERLPCESWGEYMASKVRMFHRYEPT